MAGKPEPIDLNRALPKPPANELSPTRARSPSLRHQGSPSKDKHYNFVQLMQPASSKQQLQSVTHKLLTQGNPPFSRQTYSGLESVDPAKFSPPEGGRTIPTIAESDSSAGSGQGLDQEERVTRIEDLLREMAKAQVATNLPRYQATKYQQRPTGMSHSASENNISFRRQPCFNQASFDELQQYADFEDDNSPSIYSQDSPSFARSRGRLVHRTPSPVKTLEDIKEDHTPEGSHDYSPQKSLPMDPPISPFKRSRSPMKQLFGEKGFLGRSASMNELPGEENRKKGVKHLVEKINQRVGGMLIPASMSSRESPSKGGSPRPASTFPVSLSPPEQAKFYSEAELMICATANKYLLTQHEEGRLSHESIKKVTDLWMQKNRPQVIEFMFDQLTQRDLILYNLKTFRFYGPNAENPVSMHGMMQCWKTLAKEMSVRTFCTGDSTIRKQIQDIYKILEMLGAPMVTFLAFQQIQIKALKTMREQQQVRDEYEATKFGVERKWEPPGGFPTGPGPRGSAESEAYPNPFTDGPATPATTKGANVHRFV
ncbi:MAG: hypothetical protein Q9166_002685 [cf. Caloplaca sp. 2 TL-2023]